MTSRTAIIIVIILSVVIVSEIVVLVAPAAGQLSTRVSPQGEDSRATVACLTELSQCRNDCQATHEADPSAESAACYDNCEHAFQSCRH